MTVLLMRHYNYQKLARENTDGQDFNENGLIISNLIGQLC
jgi:hypothetical protein